VETVRYIDENGKEVVRYEAKKKTPGDLYED
jgi:hypothetical protein